MILDNCYVGPSVITGIGRQSEWSLQRISDPTIEPLTVAELKIHLRGYTDITEEDSLISSLITASRRWIEDYTGRALVDQTWDLVFSGYSFGEIKLHRSPVLSVTTFTYDVAGVATELTASNYELRGAGTKEPKIIPAYGISWPYANWERPAAIRFRAGYANRLGSPLDGAEKVPDEFKTAIKLLVGHYYRNRESVDDNRLAELPMGVKFILENQRCNLGLA